jgi:outer membrane beta-barrel protein
MKQIERFTKGLAVAVIAVIAAPTVAGAAMAAADSVATGSVATGAEVRLNAPHVLSEKSVRLRDGGTNVVRSGPGNSYAMVGVYAGGSTFPVIAKKDDWFNVRLSDSETGWVHASLCEVFDDMSQLEFRPNPRLFSRVGSYSLTLYAGGYAFDRKSNSLVLGGRLEYYLLEYIGIEGGIGWTHIVRPAEIVESLFDLALEEEDFHMLFYSFNANLKLLPGRQMVPYLTIGAGNSIMEGSTESTLNYGAGLDFFVKRTTAVTFEFRHYGLSSGSASARRENSNFEFSVGTSFYF